MIKHIIAILFITLTCFVGGFIAFIHNVSSAKPENLEQTDAVIVLTGGSERLKVGIELLRYGYANELFISGVGDGMTIEKLFDSEHYNNAERMLLKHRVSLGFSATTTRQNAIEVARWINTRNYKRLRLVTSNYHMPRSLKELSAQMPNITILTYPVSPQSVKLTEWWLYPGTTQLLILEYIKFLASSLLVLF